MSEIWRDLEDSLTVNFAYRTTDPNVGMGLHRDMESFKIYLCDTGLFVTLAFRDRDVAENSLYQRLLSDKLAKKFSVFNKKDGNCTNLPWFYASRSFSAASPSALAAS